LHRLHKKGYSGLFVFALLVVLITTCAIPAEAVTYHVAADGNDDHDGLTAGTAWATIDNGDQKSLLNPGDTINVMPGIYSLVSSATFNQSGMEANPIVYRKFGSGDVIFDAGGGNIPLFTLDGDYISFEGLILRNSSDNGIEVSGCHNVIRNCAICRISVYGVYLLSGADSNWIYNNTFYATSNIAVYPISSVKSTRIINNIIDSAINGFWAASGNIAAHNNMWNVSNPYTGGITDSAGGISVDPEFTNPAVDDYRLQQSSLCIDAGMDLGYSYEGLSPDMGALETTSGPRVYHVATDGNDDNNGLTAGTAWASIDNGDLKSLLVPGDTVLIHAGVYVVTATLRFTTNGMATLPIVYTSAGDGDVIVDGDNIDKILLEIVGNHTVINDLEFTDTRKECLKVTADSCFINSCYIHDVGDDGILMTGSYNMVYGNIIANTGKDGLENDGDENLFYHNTVYNAAERGIHYKGGVHSGRIFNNICVNCDEAISGTSDVIAGFNLVWLSTQDYTNGISDSAGGISADPLFADTAAGDFNLLTGSPAIDAGLDLGYLFEGFGPDMGALEVPFTANVYYVKPMGNDDDDGLTPATAWKSIDNGDLKGLLSPGDTVKVLPAVYNIDSTLFLLSSGTAEMPIVYTINGIGEVIVDNGGASWAGIYMLGDHAELHDFRIQNSGYQGIQIQGDSCLVVHCHVHASGNSSIRILGDYNVIYGNIVDSSAKRGLLCVDWADYNQIINNTIYACDSIGIWVTDSVTTSRVFNNIVVNCLEGIHAVAGNVCGFNALWNNTDGDYLGGVTDSAGSIYADPGMINPDNDDYNLIHGSPAIDAGLDLGFDYLYAAPDMGAIEFGQPGVLAYLEVTPEDNVVEPLDSYQLAALGYDADSAQVGDWTNQVIWSTTDPDGSVSVDGLYQAGNIAGSYYIRAQYGNLIDSGHVTVSSQLSYIRIESEDHSPFDDSTLTTDNDTTLLYCRGYTALDALLGDVSVYWSVLGDDSIGIVSASHGMSTTLLLTSVGTGQILACDSSGYEDTTGTITCLGGLPVSIDVSPDSSEVTTDSSLHFICESYDADGNLSVPPIVPSWEVIGGVGTIDADGNFDPMTVGIGQVAASGAGLNDTVGPITVTPGILNYLVIAPDTINVGIGDSVQFAVSGYDADSNATVFGNIAWTALGRVGSITTDGLFHATAVGRAKVSAVSDINDVTDTTGYIDVEELYVSTIPLGTRNGNPGENDLTVLTITIDNYFDEDKTLTGLTLHDASTGAGTPTELLGNIDQAALYLDMDDDSTLTAGDSLLTSAAYDTDPVALSFDPLTVPARTGITLLATVNLNLFARDGDSVDVYLIPASDITTGDATIPTGTDSANSMGVILIDGMVAEQVKLIATEIDTIMPGTIVYPVLTVDIPRNGYETDTLRAISIINDGTAGVDDLDQVLLYADNGNNSWDNEDVEILLGELAFTGDRWILSGLDLTLENSATRVYVGVELAAYPSNGATLAMTIPQNGLTVWSGNDGPLDCNMQATDTITIAATEAVQAGVVELNQRELIPGEISDPVAAFTLVNGRTAPAILDSLQVTLSAAREIIDQDQYDSQFDSLLLYHDLDGDITTLGTGDTLLATALVQNGEAVFVVSGLTILPTGGEAILSVATAMNLRKTRNAETVGVGVVEAEDVFFADAAVPTGDFPLTNTAVHHVNAFPAEVMHVHANGQTTLYGGQTIQPAFDFELPRNGYASDRLQELQIGNVGTLDDANALEAVQLWRDVTGDGFSGDDVAVGRFARGIYNWQLSKLDLLLTDTLTRFIITVDVINDFFDGGTLQFEIPTGGVVYASGMTGPDDIGLVDPDADLVFPSDRMTVISIPSPSVSVYPGQIGNTIMTFALYNGYVEQSKTLTALNLTNSTVSQSTPDYADYEVGRVSLYFDADKNRIYNDDSLIATGYFSKGGLRLSGLNVSMPAESLSYFFVLVDLAQELIDADSLAVAIVEPHDLSFDEPVNVNGDLPLTGGGYLVVDGSVYAQFEEIVLPSRTLSLGDTAELFAFYPPINGDLTDTLQELHLANLSSADTSDVANLSLWLDANDDTVWQATDLPLGDFGYTDGVWEISGLNLEVAAPASALFIRGEISATATPGTAFRAQVPLNGCRMTSSNDGPIDLPVNSSATLPISSSLLMVTHSPMNETYSIGQQIDLTVNVTNTWTSALDSVHICMIDIENDSLITELNGLHDPMTLDPGESADFVYTYQAEAIGEVSWQLCAVAPTLSDSSAVISTESILIQAPPGEVAINLINSIPTSVTRGQANVFPMSVQFAHPSTDPTTATLRLDSISIHVEDESGTSLAADQVFSRIIISAGSALPVIIDDIPNQSVVSLPFAQPLLVGPGQEGLLTFLVSIDSLAVAENFALALTGSTDIRFTDVNTGNAVGIDPSIAFPLKTAICRIDDASQQMAVTYDPVLNETVNFGQEYAPALQLTLRHPGDVGSSQIQLTDLTVKVVDTLDNPLSAFDVCYSIALIRQQLVVNERIINGGDSSLISMSLGSPITLNPGESTDVILAVSLNEFSQCGGFGVVIPDSTSLTVRDLASGSLLTAATDTTLTTATVFPMHSGYSRIRQPAVPPNLCLNTILPLSVAGGRDSLPLLELSLAYPEGENMSSVLMQTLRVQVVDSLGHSLDAGRLFDRIGYYDSTGAVVYLGQIGQVPGEAWFTPEGDGLLLSPGDSTVLTLIADIEADTPYDHFALMVSQYNGVLLCDATDTTVQPGFVIASGCTMSFPYLTEPTNIFLPAGRPNIQGDVASAKISYPGQSGVTLADLEICYPAPGNEGDIAIGAVRGQVLRRNGWDYIATSSADVFSAITLLLDNEMVAIDSTLTGDSVMLDLDSDYIISGGEDVNMQLRCDVKPSATMGNYVIRFADSTFLQMTDYNLTSAVYPILNGLSFPLMSSELTLAVGNLEGSFTNYPNPFNPNRSDATTISYVLDEDATVDIEIFTITGEAVKDVVIGAMCPAGETQYETWTGVNDLGLNVLPGTYFCRITAHYNSGREESFRRKIAIIR